ncbi:MAG: hypothetical protein KGL39_35330 [Patescibacteria group bacterium]|nr:hypothetical protein [Patescibacteria group bacterium]
MKRIITSVLSAIATMSLMAYAPVIQSGKTGGESQIIIQQSDPEQGLTDRQKVWIDALEWCESSGKNEAVNPKDLDGTPSYYAFQWKPGTFREYGIRYGVIDANITNDEMMADMKLYPLELSIVAGMVKQQDVPWHELFPQCVRRLGLPPKN